MNPRSINYAIELEKFLSRLGDRKLLRALFVGLFGAFDAIL